ncbi:MAG: MGMT family protein [Chromatiales bacterium]
MQEPQHNQDWMFAITTEIGWLRVSGNDSLVNSIGFVFEQPEADYGSGELRDRAYQQLQRYLQDASTKLDLPHAADGSDFQKKIWQALEHIPSGKVLTYGQLAQQQGSSARAVGGACRRNPLAVLVPCHRVVAAQGFGGYAGDTAGRNLQVKQWLIRHEAHAG